MDSKSLTRDQVEQIEAKVGPSLTFLGRLLARMDRTGFPGDDRLRRAVLEARNAMQGLGVELHYLGCKSAVGRKAGE